MGKKFEGIVLVLIVLLIVAVAVLKQTDDENGDDEGSYIFEEYIELQSVEKNIFGQWYTAQTFTVGCVGENTTHFIDNVSLFCSKVGMPNGDFVVSIRETWEKHPGRFYPVNTTLTVTSIPACNLSDVVSRWTFFDFPDVELQANTTYAIVCGAPYANETDFPRWHRVEDNGNYPCGCVASSSDYGETWGLVLDDDYLFREYGYVA